MKIKQLKKLLATLPPDAELQVCVWAGHDPQGRFGLMTAPLQAIKLDAARGIIYLSPTAIPNGTLGQADVSDKLRAH